MAHCEVLDHAHEGVVDGAVAVGVVRAHHLADDLGALGVRAVGAQTLVEHRVEDPAVDRLEPVAGVGQRALHDDRHGVLEEGSLHLEIDLDGLDVAEDHVVGRWGAVRTTRFACHVPPFLDV
jgi:hypothetical protein